MNFPTNGVIAELFGIAVLHHQAGRLKEAQQLYHQLVQLSPGHADAHHNMGVIALQCGRASESLVHFRAALENNLHHEQYWLGYLDALVQAGEVEGAQQVLAQAKQYQVHANALQPLALRIAAMTSAASREVPSVQEMNQLAAVFGQRQYAQAVQLAVAMANQYPQHGFAWKALGAAYKQLGSSQDALEPMRKAVAVSPGDAEAHSNLGATLHELGQYDEAILTLRQALTLRPDYPEAYNNLGNSLRKLEQNQEAEKCYRTAVQCKPDYAEAYSNLGITLRALGRLDEAQQSYQQAIRIKPTFAEAYNNLGLVLQDKGQRDEAIQNFEKSLSVNPEFAEGMFNLGVAFGELGMTERAAKAYMGAIEKRPLYSDAICNLGVLMQGQHMLQHAMERYLQAIKLSPDMAHAHVNLGMVLAELGRLEEARESYTRAAQLGIAGAKVRSALMLPPIMGTKDEVLEVRAQFERNLDQLRSEAIPLADPLKSAGSTNFYLAYHGLNDRDLQIKIAKYYELVSPSLLYTSAHCTEGKSVANGKTRIGFFSRYLSKHAVSYSFSKVMEILASNPKYEVTLISHREIDVEVYSDYAGKTLHVPYHLEHAREQIAELKLDVLVYLDIGMDPMSYYLAFARLAPVQCVLGGHPVTTGIGNMDYFVSSELMESANGQDHYSEKLVRLPLPLYYFDRPSTPPALKTRQALNLPVDARLYMCPMRLQKMHPEFDEAMTQILQHDAKGVVVLFEDALLPFGKESLLKRFATTVPEELRSRIIFTPWLNGRHDFMSAIAAADVILDPFHFGIGSTSALTSVTGTPLVTRRSEFMRGRVGAAYCTMLDIPECITDDTESYVSMAIKIANDAGVRKAISEKMLRNTNIFYENTQPIDELVKFLDTMKS